MQSRDRNVGVNQVTLLNADLFKQRDSTYREFDATPYAVPIWAPGYQSAQATKQKCEHDRRDRFRVTR